MSEVFHEGFEPRKIKPLHHRTRHHAKNAVAGTSQAQTSRELDAAAKQYEGIRALLRLQFPIDLS